MDPLERLVETADALLSRVDDALVRFGAPPEHPVWPLVRRLRALPGDAVRGVVALRAVSAAGPAFRRLGQVYADAADALSTPLEWAGAGADAFSVHRGALVDHVSGGAEESLGGRAAAAAEYAEALNEWITGTRDEVAWALAEVLGSAQAVALVRGSLALGAGSETGSGAGALSVGPAAGLGAGALSTASAAADIARRLLGPVAVAHDRGEELYWQWAPRLAELPLRPAPATQPVGLLRDLTVDGH